MNETQLSESWNWSADREWRIATAWMAIEHRQERRRKLREQRQTIRNPRLFGVCLALFFFFLLSLMWLK